MIGRWAAGCICMQSKPNAHDNVKFSIDTLEMTGCEKERVRAAAQRGLEEENNPFSKHSAAIWR